MKLILASGNQGKLAELRELILAVDPAIVEALYAAVPDFRRAFDVDGMSPAEFDTFGATRKTLRQFLGADEDLDHLVRDVLIPAP